MTMQSLSAFISDRRGAAGVEFAIIAPGMIALLFGMIEVNELVAASNRAQVVATALADVTSRDVSVTTPEMTGLFDAAGTIIFPGSAANLKMRVTSVKMVSAGKGEALWSDGRALAPYAVGATIDLPPSIDNPCSGPSVIYAEVQFDFTSPIGMVLGSKSYPIAQNMVMCPRVVDNVARV